MIHRASFDSPPFSLLSALCTDREKEREREIFPSILGLAFNLSLLFSFLSAAIYSTLSISRIRSCKSIPLVFFRVYTRRGYRGRYLSRFWLERSCKGWFFSFFFFVLETKAKFQFNFIDLSFACENIGRRNNINVGFFL